MIEIKFDKEKKKSVAIDDTSEIGECCYIETEETWNIVHTEVNKKYQGQGIAKILVKNVIENAKISNKNIIAECSYAKKVIERENM